MIPDWTERAGCDLGMIPEVPDSYSQLFTSEAAWRGPLWVEPYRQRWRLRYVLPDGSQRSEMFADRRRAVARELEVEERIRRGTFVDPAYLRADAEQMLVLLVLEGPSPQARRPLNEIGRMCRLNSVCTHLVPLLDGATVRTFVKRAAEFDRLIDRSKYAATTRAVARHHLRWILRRLVELELCDPALVRGLPSIPILHGGAAVPDDADYERVMGLLGAHERVAVALIEATVCRPSEFDGFQVRDWRPEMHLLTLRAQGQRRLRTKTGAVAGYELLPEMEEMLAGILGGRTSGPLFTAADGRHLTEQSLARSLAQACMDAGVLPMSLKDLRMIGASRLLASGDLPPAEVSLRLRHAGLQTSERYYWREVPGRERVAADAIAAQLSIHRLSPQALSPELEPAA